jgi:hypothetical protein
MAARVIHYGNDECHRLTVLRSAGYAVDSYNSLPQLREALTTNGKPEAVFITEDDRDSPLLVVTIAKSCSSAPLVLFRRSNAIFEEEHFDLVIDSLTPPTQWLNELQELIVHGQTLRARSRELAKESAQLRVEASAAREKSRVERKRSRQERHQQPETGDFPDGKST